MSLLNYRLTRRDLLGLGALGAVGAGWSVHLYTGAFFDKLQITSYRLASKRWPTDYPPLKITFLTDLHVGCKSVGLEELEKIVAQTNALQSDIILLGGDFVTHKRLTSYVPYQQIVQRLQKLQAPLGVHAVLGNHDWYTDGEGIWRALERVGIKVLENEALPIAMDQHSFWLMGLADYLTRRPDAVIASREITNDDPVIVLSHDPITYRDLNMAAVLQLSGHTHGGQVSLPLVGPVLSPTPGLPLDWMYGLVESGTAPMIVSSGVGTSMLPIKNTPCEVVTIEIRSV